MSLQSLLDQHVSSRPLSIVTISVACSTVLSFPVQADFVYELDSDWNLAGAVEEHNITTFTTDDNIKKI